MPTQLRFIIRFFLFFASRRLLKRKKQPNIIRNVLYLMVLTISTRNAREKCSRGLNNSNIRNEAIIRIVLWSLDNLHLKIVSSAPTSPEINSLADVLLCPPYWTPVANEDSSSALNCWNLNSARVTWLKIDFVARHECASWISEIVVRVKTKSGRQEPEAVFKPASITAVDKDSMNSGLGMGDEIMLDIWWFWWMAGGRGSREQEMDSCLSSAVDILCLHVARKLSINSSEIWLTRNNVWLSSLSFQLTLPPPQPCLQQPPLLSACTRPVSIFLTQTSNRLCSCAICMFVSNVIWLGGFAAGCSDPI